MKDFGKDIFPSANLATVQKTMEMTKPRTRRKLLDVSKGICVKGKKKMGKSVITEKRAQNETLSSVRGDI